MLAKSTYSIADFQSQCDEAWLLVDVYILFSFLYRWVGVAFSCAWTSSSQELNSSCLIACRPGLDLWGAEWWREGDLFPSPFPTCKKWSKPTLLEQTLLACWAANEVHLIQPPRHSTSPLSHSVLFRASPLYSRCTPHFKLNPHLACEQVLHFGGNVRRQASTAPKRRLKCEGSIPSFLHSLAFSYGLFHLLSKLRACQLTNPLYHKSNFWVFFYVACLPV